MFHLFFNTEIQILQCRIIGRLATKLLLKIIQLFFNIFSKQFFE